MAQDQIETLNDLLKTTIDSINGYDNSAKELQSGSLQQLFRQSADERQEVVQKLRQEVSRLGGEPADSGSAMGQMHHVWEDLKGAITGHDDETIVKQTENAEDYLKKQYEEALKTLSGEPRQLVEDCYQLVRRGHDEISRLKHQMQPES